jgi:hypothetical protein
VECFLKDGNKPTSLKTSRQSPKVNSFVPQGEQSMGLLKVFLPPIRKTIPPITKFVHKQKKMLLFDTGCFLFAHENRTLAEIRF